MTSNLFNVVGMSCGHCVSAVTNEVAKIDGVRSVQIDLATGMVTVESDAPINPASFAAAVDEAGFEVAA